MPKASELFSLQILRALAAASVVYFHIAADPNFGSFGVDIFFIISGFVMAMIVTGGQTPRIFVIHRIARIVPLYWILTTGLLLIATLKPQLLNSTAANIPHYLESLFFVPYFKKNGALNPMLAVGWTLNYEMFFYGCILIGMVAARAYYALITALLIGISYVFLGHSDNAVLTGFFGNEIIFEFLFGIVAFTIYHKNYLKTAAKPLLLLAALCAYGFMALAEYTGPNISRLLIFGLPSLILVLATVHLEMIGARKRRWIRILASMGDASYATYLSHLYVIQGSRKILAQKLQLIDLNTLWGVILTLGVALLVGQVLYRCVDKPANIHVRALLSRL